VDGIMAAGACDCGWKALAKAVGHADSRRGSAARLAKAGGGGETLAGA